MRVLVTHRPGGAFGYITDGWINALKDKGHEVRRFDNDIQTWNRFDPDLYIGCSAHRQDIPKNRRAKIAIHVNPYGPLDLGAINESADNIKWTVQQKPDAVFGYGFETDRLLWSYWTTKYDIPWVPMPTAADKVLFRDLGLNRVYDVVYLGGRWSYKGLTIDSYLIPVLRDQRINYKLYGWGDWQPGFCSGILAEDKVVDFLNTGKVGPCISERHTQSFGIDIPERAWKLALCGTLVIHDPIPTMRDQFKSVLMAQTPQLYCDMCVEYSCPENEEKRLAVVNEQKREVLSKHTYHHRLAGLLAVCGWDKEAAAMVIE